MLNWTLSEFKTPLFENIIKKRRRQATVWEKTYSLYVSDNIKNSYPVIRH